MVSIQNEIEQVLSSRDLNKERIKAEKSTMGGSQANENDIYFLCVYIHNMHQKRILRLKTLFCWTNHFDYSLEFLICE
jgi:hypothetical protein